MPRDWVTKSHLIAGATPLIQRKGGRIVQNWDAKVRNSESTCTLQSADPLVKWVPSEMVQNGPSWFDIFQGGSRCSKISEMVQRWWFGPEKHKKVQDSPKCPRGLKWKEYTLHMQCTLCTAWTPKVWRLTLKTHIFDHPPLLFDPIIVFVLLLLFLIFKYVHVRSSAVLYLQPVSQPENVELFSWREKNVRLHPRLVPRWQQLHPVDREAATKSRGLEAGGSSWIQRALVGWHGPAGKKT